MSPRSQRQSKALSALVPALLLLAAAAAVLVAAAQPQGTVPPPLAQTGIYDRPLLTEAQKAEARETGYCAFSCGGTRYVTQGMPEQYL